MRRGGASLPVRRSRHRDRSRAALNRAEIDHGANGEGIDGSRVDEMVRAGQIEEVARYCESDVLNTYRVWLVYELFRGAITAEQLAWSETQIREFVATRKTTNPHLCAAVGIEKGPP